MRLTVVTAVVLGAFAISSSQPAPAVEPWREFPSYDSMLAGRFTRGIQAERAERERLEAPGALATIKHLFEVGRIDSAVDGIRIAAADATAGLAAVVELAAAKASQVLQDRSHDYADRLKAALAPARDRIPRLSREDAATLARAFVAFDNQYNRLPNGSPDRLKTFVQQYAGTKAAMLAEVDLNYRTDVLQRISDLDAFWKTHPASEAGAKALYQKGWELHVNVAITGVERRGSDPTDRFLRVVAIVDELESGRYPDCEWVRQAPGLIPGFFVSDSPPPAYSKENVARTLAEYARFVAAHFPSGATEDLIDTNVGYLITSKMGALYQLQGDRAGGIEGFLTDLEAKGHDRNQIELMRGRFLAREAAGDLTPPPPDKLKRAEDVLSKVARAKAGYPSRKAAAELAALFHRERMCDRAAPLYLDYVAANRASPWSWAALVHAGQCLSDLGQTEKAAELFARSAAEYPNQPLAVVLGATLEGRAFDTLGTFDRSLASHKRALAAWDPNYGGDVPAVLLQRPLPGSPTGIVPMSSITREMLADRVATLERHLADPSGHLVERGISLIAQRQFADAKDMLAQAVQRAASDSARSEARLWLHRADLETALELAAVEGPARDDTVALTKLEALTREPFDGMVGAAGITRATLLFKLGKQTDADVAMQATLNSWIVSQRPLRAKQPASPMAADLAEIRQVVFQPTGGLSLLARSWNAFEFPASISYVTTRADLRVKLADGTVSQVGIYQDLPGFPQTIYLTSDEVTLWSRLIVTLGGTKTRATVDVMETPNQPVGTAVDVMRFWSHYFPTRQGHWGGWVVETYPTIGQIEFLNPERTRAGVAVTIGYSGCTVMMEKKDGHWVAVAIVNQWIT